jgi:hypothetical protein
MRVLTQSTQHESASSQQRRCDTLYELALQKKHKLEVMRLNRQEDREREELQEATFRPVINHNNNQIMMIGGEQQMLLGVAERNQAWHENRQKKI